MTIPTNLRAQAAELRRESRALDNLSFDLNFQCSTYTGPMDDSADKLEEAADEISRLTARVAELEGALRECVNPMRYSYEVCGYPGTADTNMDRALVAQAIAADIAEFRTPALKGE